MLLAASLLLHLVLLGAIDRRIVASALPPRPLPQVTVFVGTVTPETKTARPQAMLPEAPPLKLQRPDLPLLPAPPVVIASPETPVSDGSAPTIAPAPAADDAVMAANAKPRTTDAVVAQGGASAFADGAATTPGSASEPVAPSPAADPATRQYRVSLPPSARLAYEIRYSTRGNITHGTSVIDWEAGSTRYTVRGEATKFGIPLSSFRSEGTIDAAGLEPAVYAEKNLRRSETNTQFLRGERKAISFSASADACPLVAGAQDRASILWQLAGIARGDSALLKSGTVLDVFVAGVRDAEHWLIEVVGEETVPLEHGQARVWHLVRTPRAGTSDKRIDIWLAPAQQWYPVKLRYTELSGDYLDLSLAEVR